MAGLAGHLESDAIGGSVLELESSGREVVEILVEELEERRSHVSALFPAYVSRHWAESVSLKKLLSLAATLSRGAKRQRAQRRHRQGEGAYIVGRLGNIGEGGDRHFG